MAFDHNSTPHPAWAGEPVALDPKSIQLAFSMISGAIKPKARARIAELLEGMIRVANPGSVVKFSVERAKPAKGTYEREVFDERGARIASDFEVVLRYFEP